MKKQSLKFKRILIKLSGEAFQSPKDGEPLDMAVLNSAADEVCAVKAQGVEVAIVVGGGNIYRGQAGAECGIDRTTGDFMGMLATVINALALQSALERKGCYTRVMTALAMAAVAEPFIRRRAIRHLEKGRVVIFGAGTGNPFFTTDSAAALRASEIDADLLVKGTKVDGIYTADPMKDPKATRYQTISYQEAISKRLRVMDTAAFSLCQENHVPIIVCNFFKQGELVRAVRGEPVGTLVGE
jgi:uridylate kinase